MVAQERTKFHTFKLHTEMHDRGWKTYLDLQPSATSSCCGWILMLAVPDNSGLPGSGRRSVSFLPSSSAEVLMCHANQRRTEKKQIDAHSTSRLGVSRR